MMEPVSEALTISVMPLESATMAMINSAALPKVAFSNPPTPALVRSAKCSVDLPIQPANGMIATQANMNAKVGSCWK